jgi:hypothetical protein
LRDEKVTSVLIGASKTAQLDDAVGMLETAISAPKSVRPLTRSLRRKHVTLAKSALIRDLGVPPMRRALPPVISG